MAGPCTHRDQQSVGMVQQSNSCCDQSTYDPLDAASMQKLRAEMSLMSLSS